MFTFKKKKKPSEISKFPKEDFAKKMAEKLENVDEIDIQCKTGTKKCKRHRSCCRIDENRRSFRLYKR